MKPIPTSKIPSKKAKVISREKLERKKEIIDHMTYVDIMNYYIINLTEMLRFKRQLFLSRTYTCKRFPQKGNGKEEVIPFCYDEYIIITIVTVHH